jgi:hypothetical protein
MYNPYIFAISHLGKFAHATNKKALRESWIDLATPGNILKYY